MGKAILASPPFIVTQENRNTPKSKAQFLTLIKNIENTFISTMISITAQKEGRDGPTKKIKTERITEHFNQAQPSDEEFTQYYEGLIHAISHLTNKMMTEKESYKLTYKDGKPQILRYRAETNDIVEIAKNIKYKSKFLSGKEKEFSTNEPNLPFSKNNKRKKETIESSNGEKITYYFSKSHVDLTGLHALLEEDGYDSKLPKYSYNIERVSGNERILLKINPTDDKNGGEYA